jgi:hypothetical protein
MNTKIPIFLFAVFVIGLASCKKGTGDLVPTVLTSSLDVINAGADTVNFYENGTRLNNTSNLYPLGTLGYLSVTAGAQNYQVKKAGNPNTLITIPLTLSAANGYTLFIAGETADKTFMLKDQLGTDTTKGAWIRFVNASPIDGTVDVTIGAKFSYKNIAFKSATPYTKVSGGLNLLTIYQSGSSTPLTTPGNLNLTVGGIYTLYTKGVLNGTGNSAIGARIIQIQ